MTQHALNIARTSPDQFVADGDLIICYLPTGNRYTVYATSNVTEFYVLRIGALTPLGAAGEVYSLDALCAMARPLLARLLTEQKAVARLPPETAPANGATFPLRCAFPELQKEQIMALPATPPTDKQPRPAVSPRLQTLLAAMRQQQQVYGGRRG